MDPLAQLADIHLPEPISQAPIAPGWWLLYASCIALVIFVIVKSVQYYRLTKVKRALLKQLSSHQLSSKELTQILKYASLHYFQREQVASLYGSAWLEFLKQQLPPKKQAKFCKLSEALSQDHYQAPNNKPNNTSHTSEQAIQAAKFWLTNALPPKVKRAKLKATSEAVAVNIAKESHS